MIVGRFLVRPPNWGILRYSIFGRKINISFTRRIKTRKCLISNESLLGGTGDEVNIDVGDTELATLPTGLNQMDGNL